MDLMEIRRRMLMGQKIPEQWDFVLIKTSQKQTVMLDVIAGQTMTVQWESPTDIGLNMNGWVLNGNDCCASIGQIRNVGISGEQTIPITASGQVKVGGYSGSITYSMSAGSIIRIRFE